MSHFMSTICSVVLSDSPPLSNVTPLPTRAERRPVAGVAGVAQDHEPRRPVGPAGDAEEGAHPLGFEPRLVPDLALEPDGGGRLSGRGGERLRVQVARRRVDQLAGEPQPRPPPGRGRAGTGRSRRRRAGRVDPAGTASASDLRMPGAEATLRPPDADAQSRGRGSSSRPAAARPAASVPNLLAGDRPRRPRPQASWSRAARRFGACRGRRAAAVARARPAGSGRGTSSSGLPVRSPASRSRDSSPPESRRPGRQGRTAVRPAHTPTTSQSAATSARRDRRRVDRGGRRRSWLLRRGAAVELQRLFDLADEPGRLARTAATNAAASSPGRTEHSGRSFGGRSGRRASACRTGRGHRVVRSQ